MEVKRGGVYTVDLNPTRGSETKKIRPCVIVSDDSINRSSAVIIVCPILDGFKVPSPIHIEMSEGEGGLTKESIVHCGQVRAIDKERLVGRVGHLDEYKMAKISKGLKYALGINF